MATVGTVGTEDSNLVFQFNSPVNRPVPAMYYEGTCEREETLCGGEQTEEEQSLLDSQLLGSQPSSSDVLRDARIYSQFNNYLNERWMGHQPEPRGQREQRLLLDRRLKLEELVDKFWLKDGEIDESLFEDSSDEEGL